MFRRGFLLGLAAITFALAGCSREPAPTSPDRAGRIDTPRKAERASISSTALVNGYSVQYTGRTQAGGQTTFSYTVSGTGVDPALSNFVIQLPTCAPALAASSPTGGSVGTDPNSALYGIKWNQSLGTTASRNYSITFPGNVAEGIVKVAVKAGTGVGIAVLPGPCGGYLIEGGVFVDSDGNGAWNPIDEPGVLPDVTVTLIDDQGSESVVTDANGRYSFTRLEGTYTVRIDATTPGTDFNEELFDSFSATGSITYQVTVGPDATNLNFGFKPLTQKLINDFDTGALTSDGLAGSFWTKAIRAAQRGSSYQGYNATTLLAMLAQIEGAFFTDPYPFTSGNELKEALAILTSKSRDPVQVLYKELFIAELNWAAGKGIIEDEDLMEVLLAYGESLIIDRLAPAGGIIGMAASEDPDISDATELYRIINSGRGGGDVPD